MAYDAGEFSVLSVARDVAVAVVKYMEETVGKGAEMISPVLERELRQHLEHLPFSQQRQVLDFARALASSRAQGVAGRELLQFAGTIDLEDLEVMSQSITADCEKVDTHEW